jgi:hypothetical protein
VAGERSRTSTWSAPAPSEDRRPQPGASPRPRERRLHRRHPVLGAPCAARALAEVDSHAPPAQARTRFCGHYVYYKFPFTFGQVVLFEEMDQMLRFARNKLHRELMSWVTDRDAMRGRASYASTTHARAGHTRTAHGAPRAPPATSASRP